MTYISWSIDFALYHCHRQIILYIKKWCRLGVFVPLQALAVLFIKNLSLTQKKETSQFVQQLTRSSRLQCILMFILKLMIAHSGENHMLKKLIYLYNIQIVRYIKLHWKCSDSNFIKIAFLGNFQATSHKTYFFEIYDYFKQVYFERRRCNIPKKFCIIGPFV